MTQADALEPEEGEAAKVAAPNDFVREASRLWVDAQSQIDVMAELTARAHTIVANNEILLLRDGSMSMLAGTFAEMLTTSLNDLTCVLSWTRDEQRNKLRTAAIQLLASIDRPRG